MPVVTGTQGMKERLSFHALTISLWPGNFYSSHPLHVSSGSDHNGTIFIHLTAAEMVCLRPPQETVCAGSHVILGVIEEHILSLA